jgi:ferredoxin
MRLVVDLTRCDGYGQCAFLAAGVFRGREVPIDGPVPNENQHERVLRAARRVTGHDPGERRAELVYRDL